MENSEAWKDFKKWWVLQDNNSKKNGVKSIDQAYSHHPLIASAMSVGNCVIVVMDIRTMQYIYNSPNYEEYSGWNKEDYLKGGVEFAFSRMPPDDQVGITVFSEVINNYFRKLPDNEKGYFRSFWDYRCRNNKGELFKVIQQDCALKYSAEGQIEELLAFITKIENVSPSESQHLRITNGRENFFYKYDHKLKTIFQLQLLSEREMEIVRLIAKSKSLKQIAAALNISFNTVKAHSTKMMQKLQVNDSLEMVNLLRVWGFI